MTTIRRLASRDEIWLFTDALASGFFSGDRHDRAARPRAHRGALLPDAARHVRRLLLRRYYSGCARARRPRRLAGPGVRVEARRAAGAGDRGFGTRSGSSDDSHPGLGRPDITASITSRSCPSCAALWSCCPCSGFWRRIAWAGLAIVMRSCFSPGPRADQGDARS